MAKKMIYSTTFKAFTISVLTLLLLIPSAMIENLIEERQERSLETVRKINDKWSTPQTVVGPILSIPYDDIVSCESNQIKFQPKILHITPETLLITTSLEPEERYFGIYKTILYKSNMDISGSFKEITASLFPSNARILWNKAYITLEVSDLRGITQNIVFNLNGKALSATTIPSNRTPQLNIPLDLTTPSEDKSYNFTCNMRLNGSESINFVPVGRSTQVSASGAWNTPSFQGAFSAEQKIENGKFNAQWNILSFNRDIPATWSENMFDQDSESSYIIQESFQTATFGVNLIEPVDHYQQNMRSSKYSFMFVSLTFLLFFFVELLTKRRIHPIQYLLVGAALLLFYTLLLSISEQWNFTAAYAIAASAIIALITAYASSVFKVRAYTTTLCGLLCLLYIFLYVVLQLEDVALLIGSIGLFAILATTMFFSRKITWYKEQESPELPPQSPKQEE